MCKSRCYDNVGKTLWAMENHRTALILQYTNLYVDIRTQIGGGKPKNHIILIHNIIHHQFEFFILFCI